MVTARMIATALMFQFLFMCGVFLLELTAPWFGARQVLGIFGAVFALLALFLVFIAPRWSAAHYYALTVVILSSFFFVDALIIGIFGVIVSFAYLVLMVFAILAVSLSADSRPAPCLAASTTKSSQQRLLIAAPPQRREYVTAVYPAAEDGYVPVEHLAEQMLPIRVQSTQSVAHENVVEKAWSRLRDMFLAHRIGKVEQSQQEMRDDLKEATDEIKEEVRESIKGVTDLKDLTFVSSTNGKRYHMLDCMIAQRIPKGKRVLLKGTEKATEMGFSPCGVCVPGTQ
ncbi:MAG: hypothetical protein ABIH41_06135 [Nanoarchaeota archaeon]